MFIASLRGRPLILGGVTIPSDFGLEGHSDADILSHAITDALLGALRWATSACIFPIPIRNGRAPTAHSFWSTPPRW